MNCARCTKKIKGIIHQLAKEPENQYCTDCFTIICHGGK